ncbi:hypothetical protein [Pseudaminobacter sp. NGMCC 1.201702]|uniref:hypothetical protein n=1 Tax=Pseudaminobacter sp. NGMCC 1.201702 TaxID=3391825 RepID=UPI0039EF6E34
MVDADGHEIVTLRDWFAGQATEGDISMYLTGFIGDQWVQRNREEAKYAYADAMLAARFKDPS